MRVRQGRGQDLFCDREQLRYTWIPDAVVDAGADPPALQDTLLAQRGEVLRSPAGVEAQLGLQVSNGAFPVGQELEYPDPHGMAKDAEELGLHDVDGI